MGLLKKLFTCGAILVALAAIFLGACLSGTATRIGFFRFMAGLKPEMVGFAPAFAREQDLQVGYSDISKISLKGQTAVVTGANVGLGYNTALHLARQGAKVFLCCRTPSKCTAAAEKIRSNSSENSVTTITMDTSNMKSVKVASKAILSQTDTVDMLVLNAGIGVSDGVFRLSEDGFENVLATNQIGHHLLFKLLKPALSSGGITGATRVVSVSSAAHFDSYGWGVATDKATMNNKGAFNPMLAYGQSKLANVLFAQEVSRRAADAGEPIFANVLHPGAVDTNIWEQLPKYFKKSVEIYAPVAYQDRIVELFMGLINQMRKEFMWTGEDGALTQIYLAASPAIGEKKIRGRYFHPQVAEVPPNPVHANNLDLQKRFFDFCDELVAPFAE